MRTTRNWQWMVRVGATEDANPAFAEHSGYNYFGPFTGPEAQEFKEKVEQEWMRATADHGVKAFVYGKPEVTLYELRSRFELTPEQAARNWFYVAEDYVEV